MAIILDSLWSTWHKLEFPEKREQQLRSNDLQVSLRGIFLISDWFGGKDHCGVTTSSQVILRCLREQAEQAMESKSVGSTPPWHVHCLEFLLWLPWVMEYKLEDELNLSLFKLLLVMVFISAAETLRYTFSSPYRVSGQPRRVMLLWSRTHEEKHMRVCVRGGGSREMYVCKVAKTAFFFLPVNTGTANDILQPQQKPIRRPSQFTEWSRAVCKSKNHKPHPGL